MSKVTWHGAKVKAAFRDGAEAGLRAAAKAVFEESQRRVPEDTSDLKNSGRLDVDVGNLRAEIRYGDGLPDPRAAIVHEKLEIHHDRGTAKYLENPMRELVGEVRDRLATHIDRHLG